MDKILFYFIKLFLKRRILFKKKERNSNAFYFFQHKQNILNAMQIMKTIQYDATFVEVKHII